MTRVRLAPSPARFAAGPSGLPRLLRRPGRGNTVGFDAHRDEYGPLPALEPRGVVAAVERSGLRGHGGAGFPTARKLRAVAEGHGPRVVVANGCEGEPASTKDKLLVERHPHLVLDGLVAAAVAVDARDAVIAVERTRPQAARALSAAIAERPRPETDAVPMRVVSVPGRYVAGEESALVHWLNGGDAKPTAVPPRPFERGVGGRPTLVQNVETLAHLGLITRYGPDWFRELGTADDPGTTLITVSGAVTRPGVCEIALGTSLGDVLAAAGGESTGVSAYLVGGYFGTWIAGERAPDVRLDREHLDSFGSSLGCGVVAALPDRVCGLVETARVVRYLSEETAGQCGPCVHGLGALSDAVTAIAQGAGTARTQRDIDRWMGAVARRGACHHPDGAIRFLRSALEVFEAEVALHARSRCSATSREQILPIPAGTTRDWGWR